MYNRTINHITDMPTKKPSPKKASRKSNTGIKRPAKASKTKASKNIAAQENKNVLNQSSYIESEVTQPQYSIYTKIEEPPALSVDNIYNITEPTSTTEPNATEDNNKISKNNDTKYVLVAVTITVATLLLLILL
jgi:hypothetical protein